MLRRCSGARGQYSDGGVAIVGVFTETPQMMEACTYKQPAALRSARSSFSVNPGLTTTRSSRPFAAMCHGHGLQGSASARLVARSTWTESSDGGSESDANTWLSDENDEEDPEYPTVDVHKLERKTARRLRYISHGTTGKVSGSDSG